MIGYDNDDGLFGEFIFGEYGWTPPGYEDELWKHYWQNCDYAVSTHGRVWSCRRNRFLQPVKSNRDGHLSITMCYHGMQKQVYIHRLVAEMFIPNPYNLPVVRHLDGDPTNNVVYNLAWGTTKDNWEDAVRHGTARPLSDDAREKALVLKKQPVIAISESDGSHFWFPSQSEAARELRLQIASISRCLEGRQKRSGRYTFVRAQGGEVNADCPEQLY